ncbi:transposase InsO family protein/transposase-like protein [Ensifer adhaerens]|uniref:Transposase InsO family protein/transposase-like protein n=1 Tax=Ensifer adhaerens TaxID=106592 RepID=A0ACC5STZ3_ENSAD|nr:IS3 family transposase [Ensifer adhaerens]MBP1872341.1 transposase InsO family protein/transposase-like protein [Ensifer adhaerens]
MYSYEDRMRAVQLYIKLGRRVKATIRQLGYPTKNALKQWCREYERGPGLSAGYVRTKRRYSDEQKRIAVEHYLSHGRCIAWTIKALGYPCRGKLSAWIDEYEPDGRRRVLSSNATATPRSEQQKRTAVIDLCSRRESARSLAQKVGVSRQTLYDWKNQKLGREVPASMTRRRELPPTASRDELERELEALRRDVQRLQLEHDLLKKANELIKKDLGIDVRLLANREKTLLVDALRQIYALPELLTRLEFARSSYFYHRSLLCLDDQYAELRQTIVSLFEANRNCYGYRRIHAALTRRGEQVSEKVVRRLMKQEQLVAATVKRRRYTSYQGELDAAPENLVNRDFHAARPNEKWLTDITEFQLPAGKVYLSPIIDCFDGLVVSWYVSTRPDAELVNTMLDAAIETISVSERPVVHSDRGAHYRWPGWLSRIHNAQLARSMSRKGCSPDNSACEGFFGRLKNEMYYHRDWINTTLDDFMQQVDSYIRWYNQHRIKISLGGLSPAEYRRNLGIAA